jgi:uncharacterized protein (TIGR02118 family)
MEGLGGLPTALSVLAGVRKAGSPAPYLALGHLYFESVDAFQKAWAPHAAQIVADVPNF